MGLTQTGKWYGDFMKVMERRIRARLDEVVELRRDLHEYPELAYTEIRTADAIVEKLKNVKGLQLQKRLAGTGIVATLGTDLPGPCLALRADMDGLPINEEGNKTYKSKVEGKMHACGHDGHMACLVGAAMVLSDFVDELKGPVKFIFQPAEEGGAGGRRMCEEGVLENPSVDAIFGLHGTPDLQIGQIYLRTGTMLASADEFSIKVEGLGAHAAFPHQGVDSVYVASQIVVALQSIVARNTDPLDSVVVTVGKISAGSTSNVIPQTAELLGTVRALTEDTRKETLSLIKRVVEHTASAYGAKAKLLIHKDGYPPTVNDPRARSVVEHVVNEVLGKSIDAVELDRPIMGAEDFAFYGQHIPAFFFALGLRDEDADGYPMLHQPNFDFNDNALFSGIKMHVAIACHFGAFWNAS